MINHAEIFKQFPALLGSLYESVAYQISIIIIMINFEPCMFLYSELCILVCSSESYRILGFNPYPAGG